MDPRIILYALVLTLILSRCISYVHAQAVSIGALMSDAMSTLSYPDHEHGMMNPDDSLSLCGNQGGTGNGADSLTGPAGMEELKCRQISSSMTMMVQGFLGDQELILEIEPADSLLYVTAVSRESKYSVTVRIDEQFGREVGLFLRAIRHAELGDLGKKYASLSRTLLDPLAGPIGQSRKLVIIPHGALCGFPFEVLAAPSSLQSHRRDGPRFLIEEKEIEYNNSVTQWLGSRIRKKVNESGDNHERNLAFVGFSPGFGTTDCFQSLQDAGPEVTEIGHLFEEKGMPPVILLDENSSENNFRVLAGYSDILHIATHSISSESCPEMNGLLFNGFGMSEKSSEKEDGLLAIREICELQVPADLIVLDACSSASIRTRIGEDWLSISDCFMKAGAKNVLCTLWNVSDKVSERFMLEFYRAYLSGMSFSKALQQTKIRMIRDSSTSLPLNWGAYVLFGG